MSFTPEQQRAYRARHPRSTVCVECGGPKTFYAARCRDCSQQHRLANSNQDAFHVYQRAKQLEFRERQREKKGLRIVAYSRYVRSVNPRPCERGDCDSHGLAHWHCGCGWPIAPETVVCHICIREQARIEFKRWLVA